MNELPAVRDDASAPYLDGAARGELMVRRCTACGHLRPPYIARGPETGSCTACGHPDLEWAAVAGTGSIVSWTTAPRRSEDDALIHLGLVELTEGPWIFARLVGFDATPEIGAPVHVEFVRPGGGEPIPVFRPQDSSDPTCSANI